MNDFEFDSELQERLVNTLRKDADIAKLKMQVGVAIAVGVMGWITAFTLFFLAVTK